MHTAERSTHDPSKMVELPEILLLLPATTYCFR
jgi:hypothetical protein